MPRKIDPKNKIKPSTGLAGSDSIEANAFPDTDPNMAVGVGLEAHINDPVNAHPASAIGYENEPVYFGDNVDDVLDELGGLVPPRPPTVGNWKTYLDFVGIPDWGVLKLDDDAMSESLFTHNNAGATVYPYYHNPPKRWSDLPLNEVSGADLVSDSTFNVYDITYGGGGIGVYATYAGGFARTTDIIETHNITKDSETHCVISGSLFPSDRGTIAIFHIPAEGDLTDIECVAALNCGQGIEDGCDGETGGIWNYGVNDDPYQFPSAASGQYDLQELHTGYVRNTVTTINLIEPSGNPSIANIHLAVAPDILVGVGDKIFIQGSDSTPSVDGEWEIVGVLGLVYQITETITVNGSTGVVGQPLAPSDFDPSNADDTAGQVREEYTILGGTSSSVLPTKGVDSRDDNNFFRYRMPYLENYEELLWTPPSQTSRYFTKPPISLDPSDDLVLAGNYTAFNKDYWTFQIARYRHRFDMSGVGERGSYFIIHFKKEEYFENLLLLAQAPTEDQVYSANMVDWTDIESKDNIYELSSVIKPAESYNILKSRVYADTLGDSAAIVPIPAFDLSRTLDTVLYVSGVRYFKTMANFGLDNVSFSVNQLFENTWRMGEGLSGTEQSEGFEMPNPTHYYTGQFSRNMTVTAGHGIDYNNRIEIPYTLLGAFDLTNAPQPADVAQWTSPSTIYFNATSSPVFSTWARPIVHVRQPVKHKDTNYVTSRVGNEASSKKVLVHSTDETVYQDSTTPIYTSDRDTSEDFLDEAYRWIWDLDMSGTPPAISVDEMQRILGSGLPTVGVIDIPVRIGDDATFNAASFMVQGRHLASIGATPEAQMTGLPFLNPPMEEGVALPNPPRGLLMYPYINYDLNHRPSLADGDISTVQPDYSSETGDKIFIRAFDCAFSRSTEPLLDAIGSSFFKLRIHGLQLNDFAWSGGASSGGLGIAIFVKLAGLTTWMDIGRVDGSGASKQDAFSDGAGCQVNDPVETKDGIDSLTGIVFADVLVHTGTATLYDNGVGEAPILVKVVIKDSVEGRDLTFETPDLMGKCRGLVGIELLRPE